MVGGCNDSDKMVVVVILIASPRFLLDVLLLRHGSLEEILNEESFLYRIVSFDMSPLKYVSILVSPRI